MDWMIRIWFLAHIWTNCAAQNEFSVCGQNIDLAEHRITEFYGSGSDPLGTWPWMVSVGYYNDGDWTHFCGGVIISRRFVLTAAHCMIDERLLLRIGDNNLKSHVDDYGANIREIAAKNIHPKYDYAAKNAYYDIAVLSVHPAITYTSFIRPVCMPVATTRLDHNAGQLVTVTGWGFSSRNALDGGTTLRSVPIRVYSQRNCNRIHSRGIFGAQELQIKEHLPRLFTPIIMCAGYERPLHGPCKGDSGSPLVQYHFEPSRYVLQGIVQGGIGTCGDKDFPAIFTRIDSREIYNFIMNVTGDSFEEERELSTSPLPSPGTILSGARILNNGSSEADVFQAVETTLALMLLYKDKNNLTVDLDEPMDDGNTMLLVFSKAKRQDAVKLLLQHGANVHYINPEGKNALMLAAAVNGTLSIVQLLINAGINIHQPDFEGRNALHYAAEAGNLPVLQSLVTKGIDINSRDRDKTTPLFLSVQPGKYGTVQHLLEQGADINARTQKDKSFAIHFATTGANGSSVIQLLLDYGANIESKDKRSATPIYKSFEYGFLNTTKELYRLNASLEVFNSDGESLLHQAAYHGRIGYMQWLHSLDGGDYVRRFLNYADKLGETPLMTAAIGNQPSAVRELLSYGAERTIRDKSGKTALDWAQHHGHDEIVRILD